jgi:hypothetical protein
MTKREREQVVGLLRCMVAARKSPLGAMAILDDAGIEVETSTLILAISARRATQRGEMSGQYWEVCERAAQRVEEGRWP